MVPWRCVVKKKKKTPGLIRVSGNRLVILEDAQGVISGGYVNKEAITKELPWVSFQDTCYLNTGIALLKASEGRLSLISIIHPLLCLPSTLVSHSRHFFSNITHITCEKKIIGWDHSLGGGGAHSWTFRMLTCWALALKVHVVFLKLSVFLNPGRPNFLVPFSQPDHYLVLSVSTRASFSLSFEVFNGTFALGWWRSREGRCHHTSGASLPLLGL